MALAAGERAHLLVGLPGFGPYRIHQTASMSRRCPRSRSARQHAVRGISSIHAPAPVLLVLLCLFAATAYPCLPAYQAQLVGSFPGHAGSKLAWNSSVMYLGTSLGAAADSALLAGVGFRPDAQRTGQPTGHRVPFRSWPPWSGRSARWTAPASRSARSVCEARRRPFRSWPSRRARPCARLARPHIRDLSTSNSQPGMDGSKPCSTSQRAATRLRHDHHPRITSRSTSVP